MYHGLGSATLARLRNRWALEFANLPTRLAESAMVARQKLGAIQERSRRFRSLMSTGFDMKASKPDPVEPDLRRSVSSIPSPIT